jgi:hypothetical protein
MPSMKLKLRDAPSFLDSFTVLDLHMLLLCQSSYQTWNFWKGIQSLNMG